MEAMDAAAVSAAQVDPAEARRLAAEARRAKILARGKDRLTQITTGTPAQEPRQQQPQQEPSAAAGDGEPPQPAAANGHDAHAAPAQPAIPQPTSTSQPSTRGSGSTSLAAGAGPAGARQGVGTPALAPSPSPSPPPPAPSTRPVIAAFPPPPLDGDDGGGGSDVTAGTADAGLFAPGKAAASTGAPAQGGGTVASRIRQAVHATALLRCLLALSVAYMLVSGRMERTGAALYQAIPPLAVLALTQAVLIGGVCLLLSISPGLTPLLLGAQWQQQQQDAGKLAQQQSGMLVRTLATLAPGVASAVSTAQASLEAFSSVYDATALCVVACVVSVACWSPAPP